MQKKISVKQSDYKMALLSLGAGINSLEPSVADVAEIACESDTMKRYHEALSVLGALVGQYKALLGKDRSDLESLFASLERVDQWAARHIGV